MLGADATDLDLLADALRTDGVVVDVVMGSGEAQESHDRIARLVREVPFPVYVALVRMPAGVSTSGGLGSDAHEALAALLHRRIGGAGLYLVGTPAGPQRVVSYGLDARPAGLALANYANYDLLRSAVEDRLDQPTPVPMVVEAEATVREAAAMVEQAHVDSPARSNYSATLSPEARDELADRAATLGARAFWRPQTREHVTVRTASRGASALSGVLAALVVALLLGQSLRGWPRRGKPVTGGSGVSSGGGADLPDPVVEARRARDALDRLATRLAATASRSPRDQDLVLRALSARNAAEALLDSADRTGGVDGADLADLIGAGVLARIGDRDLSRGLKGSGEPFRPCFFDPRHSRADGEVGWRAGQGRVTVPCCRRCVRDVTAGRTPDLLRVPRRGGTVPYYERDDVWARTGFGALTDSLAADVLREREGT